MDFGEEIEEIEYVPREDDGFLPASVPEPDIAPGRELIPADIAGLGRERFARRQGR